MLTVLGRANSINVRKVLWTCEEIGLDYAQEDWGGEHRSTRTPDFLALNPNGLVPVLRDGDAVLWESNTIIRYLAAKHGREDLLPAEPLARARVEQWLDWQATESNNAWRYAFQALVRKHPDYADPGEVQKSAKRWADTTAILEAQLEKAGGYVAGPDFTLADIGVGLAVNRWFLTPIERPDFPAVAAYYDRLGDRPGFRKYGCNGEP